MMADELLKPAPGLTPLADYVVTVGELRRMPITPREALVEPFLTSSSLNMVVAPRGIGKTWFTWEMACSLTLGRKFLAWEVSRPASVLVVDGEMPTAELQSRAAFLLGDANPERLHILPSEALWKEGCPLNLNDPMHQARVDEAIAAVKPEVLILDNISSLTSGLDENGNTEQDSILGWLMKLRHQGLCVILVHHVGKNGSQRGASRREDPLDTVIRLTVPQSRDESRAGAHFVVDMRAEHGAKIRGLRPRPDLLEVALSRGPHGEVLWSQVNSVPESFELLEALEANPGASSRRLGDVLSVSHTQVQRYIRDLRKRGLIQHNSNLLTTEGEAHVRSERRF